MHLQVSLLFKSALLRSVTNPKHWAFTLPTYFPYQWWIAVPFFLSATLEVQATFYEVAPFQIVFPHLLSCVFVSFLCHFFSQMKSFLRLLEDLCSSLYLPFPHVHSYLQFELWHLGKQLNNQDSINCHAPMYWALRGTGYHIKCFISIHYINELFIISILYKRISMDIHLYPFLWSYYCCLKISKLRVTDIK